MPNQLHVVVFRDGVQMVAQCLEHDIAVQASSVTDVLRELDRVLLGHVVISIENGQQPFVDLPAAPDEYQELYNAATVSNVRRIEFPEPVHFAPVEAQLRVA